MRWLNSWASGVIVAIIIATIIELLLPEGNNKKYIKIIIGIYVLFTIISPVISKFQNEEFDISAIFASTTEYEYSEAKEDMNTNKIILNTYIDNLKEDIEQKIISKGYIVNGVELEIDTDEANYGQIQQIKINISKKEEKDIIRKIETIDINISQEKEEKIEITPNETEELKKYLAETYEIEKNDIIIV